MASATYIISGTAAPVLTIASTHNGSLEQGQSGAVYTLAVSDIGTGPTTGAAVTVVESVPAGLIPASISGSNWSCTQPAGPCTRTDVLAAGASYPPIAVTLNVSWSAPATVTNQATVSGGGSGSASASDPTAIDAAPRYANPLAFGTSASVVGGVPTTLTVTYTSDIGPADIASGQVKIDNCYLAWDSSGNLRLYGSNGYADATGILGQASPLWAGNCSINPAGSSLSTPSGNPKALVLKLSVTFPEQSFPSPNSSDFVGPHEVYAWGVNAGGLDTGQVDLGALVVSQGQDFRLNLAPGPAIAVATNATADLTIAATGLNGFNSSIALSTQIQSGLGNCFSLVSAPSAISPNTQATITVRNNNCPPGSASWVGVTGAAGGINRQAANSPVWLNAVAAGDFSLAVGAPVPAALTASGSLVYPVTVASINGQVGWVSLSLTGSVPAGVTSYFSTSQVYLSGWGSTQTAYLTFYGSAATPGGTFSLQVIGALGGATHSAGFSLSTQVTTFQVTSVTGSGIVHNTGQEEQVTHTVPAQNAPVYTSCSSPDPDVTCRVISASAGTVTLGVTGSTSAVHGTRVLSLNNGASSVLVGIADFAPSLTSVQPSSITAGQSSALTLTGYGFPCDSLTEILPCEWPHVTLQGVQSGNVLTGYIYFGNWASLSVIARPDIADTYAVTADTCGMDWDPLSWEPASGDSRSCVSNAVALQVAAAPPAPAPSVQIRTADITQDRIIVALSGDSTALGLLRIEVTGSNGQAPVNPILTPTTGLGPGIYPYTFSLDTIPTGEYTTITATWTASGVNTTASMAYHFKVLGTYQQTQYNTPAESLCTGSPTPVTVYTSPSCSSSAGSMLSGFVFRVADRKTGTGSGHSASYNDVQIERYCTTAGNSFRRDVNIRGTLGPLSDSTVAACGQSELYVPGTRVFLRGIGVKTVTDRCPACCSDVMHLDNYTTNTACDGVGSLSNALTIRLY